MPFYKLSTEPSDEAKVKIEEAGHYLLAFVETEDEEAELLPIVYDTDKVFGKSTSLESPRGLHASSVQDILDGPQYGDAKTSSAFAAVSQVTLKPGQNITIASVYGKAAHIERVPEIKEIVTAPGFIQAKSLRARTLINNLTASVETTTANPLFDGAVKQMFLDNSLRGGMPTILGNVEGTATYDEDPGVKVFHAFSRIHGDLERDYNAFKIESQYFSQVSFSMFCILLLFDCLFYLACLITILFFRVLETTAMLPRIGVMMWHLSLAWAALMFSYSCPLFKPTDTNLLQSKLLYSCTRTMRRLPLPPQM
jgi:hypothetical protein